MGLISRVSSRTYREIFKNNHSKIAEMVFPRALRISRRFVAEMHKNNPSHNYATVLGKHTARNVPGDFNATWAIPFGIAAFLGVSLLMAHRTKDFDRSIQHNMGLTKHN